MGKGELPKYSFPVNGYKDDENMWEMICNLKDKKSRKDAKAKYVQPININSKYAFQVRDRQFKIKKYRTKEFGKQAINNSNDMGRHDT